MMREALPISGDRTDVSTAADELAAAKEKPVAENAGSGTRPADSDADDPEDADLMEVEPANADAKEIDPGDDDPGNDDGDDDDDDGDDDDEDEDEDEDDEDPEDDEEVEDGVDEDADDDAADDDAGDDDAADDDAADDDAADHRGDRAELEDGATGQAAADAVEPEALAGAGPAAAAASAEDGLQTIVAEAVEPMTVVLSSSPAQISDVQSSDHAQHLRLLEALLFAGTQALDERAIKDRLPDGADLPALLAELAGQYAPRGINLVKVAGGYAFRTAADLSEKLKIERPVTRKLSRASVETLAIIAFHQPVTRAEIEQVRGVGLSKGTLDLLFEQNWIRPMGRRRAPGKPVTWGTTDFFLEHFGLGSLDDLPGHEEMRAAGLLDPRAQPPIFRPEEPDLPLEPTEDEAAEPLAAEERKE